MREYKLTKDYVLGGEEYVRIVDENNKSVIAPISVVQSFIVANQRFAIYDGASDTVPFAMLFNTGTAATQDIRLEFSGPLTEEDYWPPVFNAAFFNDESAPSATKFDFRNLPLGTFVEFDVEFTAKLGDDSGDMVDKSVSLFCIATYPNGTTERKVFSIPNDYFAALTPAIENPVKLTFSTYIKDILTDSLLGGQFEFYVDNDLSGSLSLNIKNFKIQAKL